MDKYEGIAWGKKVIGAFEAAVEEQSKGRLFDKCVFAGKPPFESDSEELWKDKLDYGRFNHCVRYADKHKVNYILFDLNYKKWQCSYKKHKEEHDEKHGSGVEYTKDHANQHNMGEGQFKHLVKRGYTCFDIECFQPQIKLSDISGEPGRQSEKVDFGSPFYRDSQEVQKAKLNYTDFIEHYNSGKSQYKNVYFGYGMHCYILDSGPHPTSKKHYDKSMPNLHNITEEKFQQLVRAGYDCWDVECFEELKIDGRLDWERASACLKTCSQFSQVSLFYYCNESKQYGTYDPEYVPNQTLPKSGKKCKITKDITQEHFYGLVSEGYNVFEIVDPDPRYDWERFKEMVIEARKCRYPGVVFAKGINEYTDSSYEITDDINHATIRDSAPFDKEWFEAMVHGGIEHFKIEYENDNLYDYMEFKYCLGSAGPIRRFILFDQGQWVTSSVVGHSLNEYNLTHHEHKDVTREWFNELVRQGYRAFRIY